MAHLETDDLTAVELKWIDDMRKAFQKCPSKRLGCYTIGDADLSFFNKEEFDRRIDEIQETDDLAIDLTRLGIESVVIPTVIQVQGVCG